MKVRLTKDFMFEAAQTLPCAPEGHKCRQMHGHSFKVEITVEGEVDKKTGWFYDHARISQGPGGPAEMVPGQHHVRMNMYIAQAQGGRFRVVKNLGSIDPNERALSDEFQLSNAG